MTLIHLRGGCPDTATCPAIKRSDTDACTAYVQGTAVTDPHLLAGFHVAPDEAVVAVPMAMLIGITAEEIGR